jgi:hypothetical protein
MIISKWQGLLAMNTEITGRIVQINVAVLANMREDKMKEGFLY